MTPHGTGRAANEATEALSGIAHAADELAADAYAVGGYVRDRLVGVETRDIDILLTGAVREIAERIAAQFDASLVALREAEPTIRLVFSDRSHIDLCLPRRRTTAVDSPSADFLAEDLQSRDFTVNAMALSLEAIDRDDWREHVADPTGGSEDIRRRVIRATNPGVWQDDPARLVRALRLAAQLGFELDAQAESEIREHAGLVTNVAPERIRDELIAILRRRDAHKWLARAAKLGLLFAILPELAALQSVPAMGYHHLDGWRHALAVAQRIDVLARCAPGMSAEHQAKLADVFAAPLAGDRPRLALLKLAGLLHDVAKPSTRGADEEGDLHFYGHDKDGAGMAREAGRKLRLGRRELSYLELAVGAHMHPAFLAQEQEVSRRAAHRFFRRTGSCAPDVLVLAWADRLCARGLAAGREGIERVESLVRWLLAEWLDHSPLSHPEAPVGARAIMSRYSLEAGPAVGRLVEALQRRHAEQPFADAQEAWAFLDPLARGVAANGVELQDDDESE